MNFLWHHGVALYMFLLILGGLRWFCKFIWLVSGGFRWFQMVSDGFRWFQMVSDGFRWFPVVPRCSKDGTEHKTASLADEGNYAYCQSRGAHNIKHI